MEDLRVVENLDFEDLRHAGAVSPLSLVRQYRLQHKPKRPEKKKISRRKNKPNVEGEEEITDSVVARHFSTTSNHHWLLSIDEEDFDFDADEEMFFDAVPDIGNQPHQIYTQACLGLDVRPVRCIYEALKNEEEKIICKGLVLKHKDVQAFTIALVGALSIESLDFEGNLMGKEGAEYFGDVLMKNTYLTEIRITYNALGSPEAEAICCALLKNLSVRLLNLTGNQFNEHDAKFFKELLMENSTLRELYIGHNYFREAGGEEIAEGLANNDFLEILDLSWNHLRMKGAAAIGDALMKNRGLLKLDISWNGFNIPGSTTIAQALESNQYLTELDISCNRLSETCVCQIIKSLKANSTLTRLKETKTATRAQMCSKISEIEYFTWELAALEQDSHKGKNCLSPKGATSIVKFIQKNTDMGLEYLDISDQCVEEDFIIILDEINEVRRFEVTHGGVWSNEREPLGSQDPTESEIALLNENPLFVLMELMKVMGFRLVDLFHVLDKDNNRSISVDELKEGLEAVKIPLKRKSLERFVRGVDTDKNGEIDFQELLLANKQYKELLKEYIKDDVPIEKTDVGRIAKLVRKIIKENELMHVT